MGGCTARVFFFRGFRLLLTDCLGRGKAVRDCLLIIFKLILQDLFVLLLGLVGRLLAELGLHNVIQLSGAPWPPVLAIA